MSSSIYTTLTLFCLFAKSGGLEPLGGTRACRGPPALLCACGYLKPSDPKRLAVNTIFIANIIAKLQYSWAEAMKR